MDEEQTFLRELSFSGFHRSASLQRFVGYKKAQEMKMIDLDSIPFVIYERNFEPVGLIETAQDWPSTENKPSTITARLALMAKIPAWVVLYKVTDERNIAYKSAKDINRFRVRMVAPQVWDGYLTLDALHYCLFEIHVMRRLGIEAYEEHHMDRLPRFIQPIQCPTLGSFSLPNMDQ